MLRKILHCLFVLGALLIPTLVVGQVYPEVTIGTQVWMTKNLNVSTFRNGDPIPQAKTNEEWERAGKNQQPAWCYYDNDPAIDAKYDLLHWQLQENGKLYNWYAVNDSRGLAPVGYHIPSDAEWTKLTDFLGGVWDACTKMKSKSGWCENDNGTNSSGFSGLSGGYRYSNGDFFSIGSSGYWWSSTENSTDDVWYRVMGCYDDDLIVRNYNNKQGGFSVRCLRDLVVGEVYPEVKIGDQIWMSKNLDVSTFRNGDPIPEAKTNEEWKRAAENKQPAWCYYENNSANGAKFGKLYNWYAVNDTRGLAPEEWHIPNDADWITLQNYLGGWEIAGAKIKSKVGWTYTHSDSGEITGNGTDSSGFNGLPGGEIGSSCFASCDDGYRTIGFYYIGQQGKWWSSTGPNYWSIEAWSDDFGGSSFEDGIEYVGSSGYIIPHRECGYSVRCIKDK